MIHQGGRGPQHIAICDCERVAQADSYNNAQVEASNGGYINEGINRRAPMKLHGGCRTCHAKIGRLLQPHAAVIAYS